MGHRSTWVKAAREESEHLKEAKMEVDGAMLQEESFEVQSPKRKVIRVESEEISQEEAEELGFVPSAFSK